MSKSTETTTTKTARHFETGAQIFHKEYGHGVIVVRDNGQKYPRFNDGSTGTSSTRLSAA